MGVIPDPIVEEVRKARSEHASRFENDIDKIVKDIRCRQKKYGSKLIRRAPKLKLRGTGS